MLDTSAGCPGWLRVNEWSPGAGPRGQPPAALRLQLLLQPDRQTFIFPFAIDVCTGRKQLIATVRINCARKELS